MSPDGQYQAVCRVIARDALPQKLTLYFMQATGEPAPELADAPVNLAGIASTISQAGTAELDVEKLRQTLEAQHLAELRVGPEHQAWLLTSESVQLIQERGGQQNAPPGPGTA